MLRAMLFTTESFGEWLRNQREQAGLSQDDLAVRTGLSKSTLSLYERNQAVPRDNKLDLLAKGLGIGVDEVRAAYASRKVLADTKLSDVDEFEVMRGVVIKIDRKISKLDAKQRQELVRIIQLVATGIVKTK